MKRFKRLAGISLVVVMGLSLAACGKEEKNSTKESQGKTVEDTTEGIVEDTTEEGKTTEELSGDRVNFQLASIDLDNGTWYYNEDEVEDGYGATRLNVYYKDGTPEDNKIWLDVSGEINPTNIIFSHLWMLNNGGELDSLGEIGGYEISKGITDDGHEVFFYYDRRYRMIYKMEVTNNDGKIPEEKIEEFVRNARYIEPQDSVYTDLVPLPEEGEPISDYITAYEEKVGDYTLKFEPCYADEPIYAYSYTNFHNLLPLGNGDLAFSDWETIRKLHIDGTHITSIDVIRESEYKDRFMGLSIDNNGNIYGASTNFKTTCRDKDFNEKWEASDVIYGHFEVAPTGDWGIAYSVFGDIKRVSISGDSATQEDFDIDIPRDDENAQIYYSIFDVKITDDRIYITGHGAVNGEDVGYAVICDHSGNIIKFIGGTSDEEAADYINRGNGRVGVFPNGYFIITNAPKDIVTLFDPDGNALGKVTLGTNYLHARESVYLDDVVELDDGTIAILFNVTRNDYSAIETLITKVSLVE